MKFNLTFILIFIGAFVFSSASMAAKANPQLLKDPRPASGHPLSSQPSRNLSQQSVLAANSAAQTNFRSGYKFYQNKNYQKASRYLYRYLVPERKPPSLIFASGRGQSYRFYFLLKIDSKSQAINRSAQ